MKTAMITKWTFLKLFTLVFFGIISGQVKTIKVARENINIIGLWNTFSPDTILDSSCWLFYDGMFAHYDTIKQIYQTDFKYKLNNNLLSINLGKTDTTMKFLVRKMGNKLELKLKELDPPGPSKIKTIILTRRMDRRVDNELTLDSLLFKW